MIRDCVRELVRDSEKDIVLDDSAFSPLEFGPIAWYDAADASTITESGGLVSIWRDKSGNANNAVQDTASSQPTYIPDRKNGLGGIRFRSDFLQTLSAIDFVSETEINIFIFCSRNVAGARYFIGSDVATDGSRWGFGFSSETTAIHIFSTLVGSPQDTIPAYTSGNEYHIFHGQSKVDNTERKLYYDGVLIHTESTDRLDYTSNTLMRIGQTYGAQLTDGDVNEVLIFGLLNDSQRTQITTYLADKWGMAL